MENTDFGWALRQLKQGYKLCRRGWNGQGLFIFFQKGYPEGVPANINTATALGIEVGTVVVIKPYLAIKNVQNEYVPWTPNQSDILAEDWMTA